MPFGISAALLSPFAEDGSLDADRLAAHAAALLDAGLDGVTPFGTTGEGASIGADERLFALDAFAARGLPMARVTLGITACALPDAIAQAHAAHERGVSSVLVAPPFYYPDPDPVAVHDWHAALLAALPAGLQVVLYHIPQVTGVALGADTVGRLHAAFPDSVRAVKDSSGDAASARAYLSLAGPEVLIGDERLLGPLTGEGAAGAITGLANLYPKRLLAVFGQGRADAALDAVVEAVVSRPIVPALKALLAERHGVRGSAVEGPDDGAGWTRVRAPLSGLDEAVRASLLTQVADAGAG